MTNRINLSVCATKESSFEDIKAVKTPEATDSWQPIGHAFLVDRVQKPNARQWLGNR